MRRHSSPPNRKSGLKRLSADVLAAKHYVVLGATIPLAGYSTTAPAARMGMLCEFTDTTRPEVISLLSGLCDGLGALLAQLTPDVEEQVVREMIGQMVSHAFTNKVKEAASERLKIAQTN